MSVTVEDTPEAMFIVTYHRSNGEVSTHNDVDVLFVGRINNHIPEDFPVGSIAQHFVVHSVDYYLV